MTTWLRVLLTTLTLYMPLALAAVEVDRAMAEKGNLERQPGPHNAPPTDLMYLLMEWTSLQLGLPEAPSLPPIVMTERCVIHRIWFPTDQCPTGRGIMASYTGNKVWLQDTWKPDNVYDLSLLVHELAHHLQVNARVPGVPCAAEAWEKPAYEAQFAFIRSMGSDPWMVTNLSPDDLRELTTCRP